MADDRSDAWKAMYQQLEAAVSARVTDALDAKGELPQDERTIIAAMVLADVAGIACATLANLRKLDWDGRNTFVGRMSARTITAAQMNPRERQQRFSFDFNQLLRNAEDQG